MKRIWFNEISGLHLNALDFKTHRRISPASPNAQEMLKMHGQQQYKP